MSESQVSTVPSMLDGGLESRRLSRRSAVLIALFGASMLLIQLGGGVRVLTYHEVLFSQPAKEMVAGGDWVVPRIAGVPSTHKPPMTHWLIALSMTLLGSDAEWVVRLPAVVAAIVLALNVGWLAARWFGNRVGLVAGLIQLTTVYTLQWARLAECDMILCAGVMAAMSCFAVANIEGPHGLKSDCRWVWGFYAATAFAFLTKGLAGPVFIFGGTITYFLVSQNVRGLKWFLSPIGLSILILPVAGWYAAAIYTYPQFLDDQMMHHFARFQGEMGGGKSIFYYFYNIPALVLPWTPLAMMAIVAGLRRGHYATPFWRFVACWFLVGIGVLMMSHFKSKHYAAPLLPPISIVAALGLLGFLRQRYLVENPRHLLFALASWIGCGVAMAAVWAGKPDGYVAIVGLIAGIGVSVPLMLYFERRRRLDWHLATMFATAWVLSVGVQTFVMPHHDSYRAQTELANRLNAQLPPQSPVYLLHLPENQITYYLERPLVRLDEEQRFLNVASPTESQFVLAPEHIALALASLGQLEVIDRCATINRYLKEHERLTAVRLDRTPTHETARRASESPR